jgi:hypothetical protein
MLTEIQKAEIDAVFSRWSGEDISKAIEATFNMNDELATGLCAPSIPADVEYLPRDDQADIEQQTMEPASLSCAAAACAKKPRGRPRKIK